MMYYQYLHTEDIELFHREGTVTFTLERGSGYSSLDVLDDGM